MPKRKNIPGNRTPNRYHPPRGSHTQNTHNPAGSQRLLRRMRRTIYPDYWGICSANALARYLGVRGSSIRAWVELGYYPAKHNDDRIDRWCDSPLRAIFEKASKRKKGRAAVVEIVEVTGASERTVRQMLANKTRPDSLNWKQWAAFLHWVYPGGMWNVR